MAQACANPLAHGCAFTPQVNLIIANEVTPHLTAEEYMDKGEYENELKQVLGDTRAAFDISEHDTLIFGAKGLLVAGPNARHHEPLLCSYLQVRSADVGVVWLPQRYAYVVAGCWVPCALRRDGCAQFNAMDIFIRNYFNRMFLVMDAMKQTRALIDNSDCDPNSIVKIRNKMAIVSKHIILLEEVRRPCLLVGRDCISFGCWSSYRLHVRLVSQILGYMAEALESSEIPPEPAEQSGRALYERLQIADFAHELTRRVLDLKKNMEGARHELEVLREMSNIVSETKMFALQESVNVNTRNLCSLQEANERASASLEIMYVACLRSCGQARRVLYLTTTMWLPHPGKSCWLDPWRLTFWIG